MALLGLWYQPCFLWADSLCPFLPGPCASVLGWECASARRWSSWILVSRCLNQGYSSRIAIGFWFPGPTLTTVLRVMNGLNSHYAKEKTEVQGCGTLSYPSPAPAVPYALGHSSHPGPTPSTRRECWRVRRVGIISLSLRADKKLSCL